MMMILWVEDIADKGSKCRRFGIGRVMMGKFFSPQRTGENRVRAEIFATKSTKKYTLAESIGQRSQRVPQRNWTHEVSAAPKIRS